MGSSIRGQLVSFESKSGYICKGILYADDNCKRIVIHIHGSYGNFYDNIFIQQMACSYNREGVGLLAFNLESHGGFSDGFIGKKYCYVGGAVSTFESSFEDIQGAIDFVKPFSNNIILQGHSLGTDKALYYLIHSNESYPLILISPCDSYALQKKWIDPEKVEEQIERIKKMPDREFMWLDLKEYGIKSGNENYYIPITKKAFLSLAEGFNFNFTRIEEECERYWLDTNAYIYIGGKDEFQTSSIDKVRKFWSDRISRPRISYFPNGDHDMYDVVDSVTSEILFWIKEL